MNNSDYYVVRLRNFWHLLVEAGDEFIEDHATKLSASLAYYTLFSIGPLLLVVVTILGWFYKKATVTTRVFDQIRGVIGKSATAELQSILVNMSKQTNTTLFGIIGILVFIFGATSNIRRDTKLHQLYLVYKSKT